MELARYVVEAVVLEGRSYREVARAHGVSKSWVGKLVGRYRAGGYEALEPRSRAARRIPHRTPDALEDEIVALRKDLTELGVDAGAQTIHHHLSVRGGPVPSVSTIWRVLHRRGFVIPQPHKRPRSSWARFEASLPNECWQSDVTHWRLADRTEVEICNFPDDHSRVAIASVAMPVATAPRVLRVFQDACARWGTPAALLTDNGCIYTTWHRGGPNVMQTELLALGIDYRHSRPYHPQTCGKVERFHQTLKRWLVKQRPARTVRELQAQIDRFCACYNEVRPHQAIGRRAPRAAFDARDKARPTGPQIRVGAGVRVRRDRIDKGGKVTLRHGTRLHHIGVGHAHKGKRVTLLVDGLDVRWCPWTGSSYVTSRWIRAGTTSLRDRDERLRCSDTSGHDAPTHHMVVECSRNSLTSANGHVREEYPQVKRGSTHTCTTSYLALLRDRKLLSGIR